MQIGELFVRLRGDSSPLNRSLQGAQQSLGRFESGVGKLEGSMRRLQAGFFAFSAATAGIAIGMNKAFAASDAFDASQRRLAATAKITGQSLEFLQSVSTAGQDGFRLSATLANDFSIEMTKLASKAGDVGKASAALGAFLNLGAARGLDATKTLQAVQQAILGIDEGTDKLFGANPSVLYKQLADSIGISVQAMTDQQKAQALLTAALRDGGKVAGEYAEFLKSPAGAQALFAQRTEESARRVGSAWAGIRAAALPVLAAFTEAFAKVVEYIPKGALIIARGIAFIPEYALKSLGKVIQGLAWFADAFTQAVEDFSLGHVELGSGLADGLRAQGNLLSDAGAEMGERVGRNFARMMSEASADVDLARLGANIDTGITQPLAEATAQAEKLAAAFARLPAGTATFGLSIPTSDRVSPTSGANQRGIIQGVTAHPGTGSVPIDPASGGGLGGMLSGLMSQVGGQIMGLVAQFGPLAAVAAALRPVFQGIMDTIGPILDTLSEPLRIMGQLLGAQIVPILRLLEPPLRLLARISSYVTQALGTLIRAIGKAVDAIPGISAKGLIRTGEEMIQAAKDARRALDTTAPAVEDLGEAAAKASASLVNYARVAHINALRFGVGAGMGGGGGVTRPGGRPAMEIIVNAVPGAEVLVKEGGKVIQNVRSRGGTTHFALAT